MHVESCYSKVVLILNKESYPFASRIVPKGWWQAAGPTWLFGNNSIGDLSWNLFAFPQTIVFLTCSFLLSTDNAQWNPFSLGLQARVSFRGGIWGWIDHCSAWNNCQGGWRRDHIHTLALDPEKALERPAGATWWSLTAHAWHQALIPVSPVTHPRLTGRSSECKSTSAAGGMQLTLHIDLILSYLHLLTLRHSVVGSISVWTSNIMVLSIFNTISGLHLLPANVLL